jgi:hypothetical protein
MAPSNLRSFVGFICLSLCIQFLQAASLPACPDRSQAEFDFVVVGAGVGGGPLAARLAESGFSGIDVTPESDGRD